MKRADDPEGWLLVGVKRDGRVVLNKCMGGRIVQTVWLPGLASLVEERPA